MLLSEKPEQTKAKRVLHRRSSSIALFLGLIIFSPFLMFLALEAFSGFIGCHLDSSLSSGCIIGDTDYSSLVYRLSSYSNLSAQILLYWQSLTLIWMAIALYEAQQIQKVTAVAIGGASILVSIFNDFLWALSQNYYIDIAAYNLLWITANWGLVIGVFVALTTFAMRNGFEVPPSDARGALA